MTPRRTLLAGLMALACAPAWAQTAYPNKPIRLIVGNAAGGAADAITRVVGQALGKELGQQVVVENKPGAEGSLAALEVMRAPADGHTLLMGTNSALVKVPSFNTPVPYDPFKAFTPISSAGQFAMFLVVNKNLPVKTAKELQALVAAQPGKYNSGSSNSAAELAMIQLLGQGKAINVRYKGDVPALTDLVGDSIHMIWTTGTSAPAFVKDGRVKALVTLQPERSPLLPEVPTATEAGVNDKLGIKPWAGFFGPAGMPPEVTQKLSAALQKVLKAPEVREQLVAQGFDGYGMSPQQFSVYFKEQYDGFNRVVRENNIKFE
ncbi:Bug family tripartite tricarboxylate transporter substrate binding protein [Aquabacterium sp. J223]|uniref:Bug family tripartite tricarboxylate transporter substrate binding protein n=1 Tax=Aquabacterium sp. J223 TaxID=2898431 RepID=UPI0021AE1B13|nr:tripartite tricarboxylate transporter substrate binding protein [Aquabacterium sp. J223]UUX97078.1 tripartite tricarboxylate transporter substrate binding protein [Aquabacterium sp. J223]